MDSGEVFLFFSNTNLLIKNSCLIYCERSRKTFLDKKDSLPEIHGKIVRFIKNFYQNFIKKISLD